MIMRILLVEPNYKNKYPPMGLMKISTYHKGRGDEVTFYKGVMDSAEFYGKHYDRVYITSLFTFYYNQTVKTIKSYEKLISPEKIFIGGIMVSLMKEKIKEDIDDRISILTGLLTDSSILGLGDSVNIDILPLDYSILDDIVYKYPAGDNYFAYISRGCTNKCSFCAVPILEPEFCMTNNIVQQVKTIGEEFGEKKNLLLLDNNILSFSENELEQIVSDIESLGFDKKTKFYKELPLKQFMRKLHRYESDTIASKNVLEETLLYLKEKKKIKKSKIYQEKYLEIMGKIECSEDKLQVLFENENELIEILDFYHRPVGSRRAVDFNQGMDARQLTDEKMRILSRIPIEPFRLAFDSIKYKTIYSDALKIAAKYGVSSFSNYILYNCDDKPEELWERLKVNVDLAKELKVKIFSFPMKYAPINRTDRKFVGKFWNKKYLKNIYAILNVTKGIVADGESFFFKAFGRNVEEFYVILSMPKEFVTYRNYFEENGLAAEWRDKFLQLSIEEKNELLPEILTSISSCFTKAIRNSKEQFAKEIIDSQVIVDMIILKSFIFYSDEIKKDEKLINAYEDILLALTEIRNEKAAVLLDEFRIH